MWFDGICEKCGCLIVETSSNKLFDYMNTCTNPNCENFGWHHCYDIDFLEYYGHKTSLEIESMIKDVK